MTLNNYSWPAIRGLLCLATVLAMVSVASAEWKEKVLYSFQGGSDGATPAGGVVFDKAGNLYGATSDGGSACPSPGCGTVFQLVPPAQKGGAWSENILHLFQGTAQNDGYSPEGGVILDAAGDVFGTTAYGGTGNCMLLGSRVGCGTVFEMMPPANLGGVWTEKVLYSFQGDQDGQFPFGDLVFDKAGNLYGATYFGGGYGSCDSPYYQHCGTVFELSPPKTKDGKWAGKVLYSFKGGKDGANPNGGLIFDSTGAIYGTTFYGGGTTNCKTAVGTGCGTVFELVARNKQTGSWGEVLLHRFQGGTGDTGNPLAGLTWNRQGKLFGTAVGGTSAGHGAIFQLLPPGQQRIWKETLLHTFGCDTGCAPAGGLVFDSSGTLYGGAAVGPTFAGVVFRLRRLGQTASWKYAVLYNFRGPPDGLGPEAALVLGKSGNLFGTTVSGGTGQRCRSGCGTVFQSWP